MAEHVDDHSSSSRSLGISSGDKDDKKKNGAKSSSDMNLADDPEEDEEEDEDGIDDDEDDEGGDDEDDTTDDRDDEEVDKQHDDDEEDEKQDHVDDEVVVMGDNITLLNGVQMKCGLSLNQRTALLDHDPALQSAVKRFTTTIKGLDFSKFVKQVVQTNGEFRPTTRIFGVVLLWNKRRKPHFFNDAYFSQKVFSDEIGSTSFVSFLSLRGWSVTHRKTKDDEIEIDPEYRRMDWLIHRAAQRRTPQENHVCLTKYFQLMAFMERIQKYLRSQGAFRPAPSSRILLEEKPLQHQIEEAIVQETGGKAHRKKKSATDKRNVLMWNISTFSLHSQQSNFALVPSCRSPHIPTMGTDTRSGP